VLELNALHPTATIVAKCPSPSFFSNRLIEIPHQCDLFQGAKVRSQTPVYRKPFDLIFEREMIGRGERI